MNPEKNTYFVTGATGFLGGRLVETLLNQGHVVVAYGRNRQRGSELEKSGAIFRSGSLNDLETLRGALPEGSRVVHCAALCDQWGDYSEFVSANVEATRHTVQVALEKKSPSFVHISTPSIYVERRARMNVREDETLPSRMINHYATTKLQAEEHIRQAVDAQGLPAIILRPQGIFGPGDRALMPRVIRIAKKGVLPVIGDGSAQIDLTYVDNVVHAILCADRVSEKYRGHVYNITNAEPVNLSETLREVLAQLSLPVREKRLPFGVAWNVASVLEFLHRNLRLSREPLLTRYSVCALGLTRTLDITQAQEELGYEPKISVSEGIRRYVEWYRQFAS